MPTGLCCDRQTQVLLMVYTCRDTGDHAISFISSGNEEAIYTAPYSESWVINSSKSTFARDRVGTTAASKQSERDAEISTPGGKILFIATC